MATIPRNESVGYVADAVPLPQKRPLFGIAAALGNAGQALGQATEQYTQARDIAFVAQQSATDELALHGRLEQLQTEAPPDGAGVFAQMEQDIAASRDSALKAAPSRNAQTLLDQRYADLRVNFGVRAQSFEAVQRGKYTVAQLNQAVGAEAAIVASDPSQFDAALGRIDTTTLDLARNGGMNPAALSEWRKTGLQDLAESKLRAELMRNPMQTYADIASHKYDQYFVGAPDRLSSLIAASVSEYTTIHNQNEKDARFAKKESQAAAFDAGLKLLYAQPAAIPAFIESNWDALSPEAKKYLHAQHDKGPLQGNRAIYSDLLLESAQRDNSARARSHFLAGDITESEFDRIASNGKAVGVGDTYKFGEKYITTKIAPTFGESDFSGKQDRTATALDKWRQWTIDHPDASDEEARKRYMGIGEEFAMLTVANNLITLGLPRYHVGGKQDLNLAATFKATEDAYAKGELNQAEYLAEQDLIHQWDLTQQAAEEAAAAQPKSKK